MFQTLILALTAPQLRYWSDFRSDAGVLFFPDRIETQHSLTHLHKDAVSRQRDADGTLVTVSGGVAQE